MNLQFGKVKFSLPILATILLFTACSNKSPKTDSSSDGNVATDSLQTSEVLPVDTMPKPGEPNYKFPDQQALLTYIDTCSNSAKYKSGIMPVIANNVPEYAEKLIGSQYSRFIVVDKASMRVLLYDRFGNMEKEYGMACARNYGTKHKKADSRTPEGFFEIEGRYDSTDWLYTDDWGNTSPIKGQFGPRFLRIKTPVTMQVGIHGTSSPWSIGHRSSHGCIRIENENIMELYSLVEKGMPVIVLPGRRDREVNRNEGVVIPYFPTSPEYAMKDAEINAPVRDRKEFLAEERAREERERLAAEKKATEMSSEASDHESTGVVGTNANPAEAPAAPVEKPATPSEPSQPVNPVD